MKKIPTSCRGVVSLYFFTLIFIIFSCRKDNRGEHNELRSPNDKFDYSEYKILYENSFKTYKSFSLGERLFNAIKGRDLMWDKGYVFERSDSSLVAEFTMVVDSTIICYAPPATAAKKTFANKTDAVFLTFHNGSRMNFYMKVVEDISEHKEKPLINAVHYTDIPAGFTGMVYYFTFDHKFINGWMYKNGALTAEATLVPSLGNSTDTKVLSTGSVSKPLNMAPNCETYETKFYNCYYGSWTSNGVTYSSEVTCDYMYSTTTTVCTGTGSGGGGSVGGGGGGGGGGTTPNPNPCVPVIEQPQVVSIKVIAGKNQVLNVPPPPPIGVDPGGGGNPPCPPVSNPPLTDIVNNLTGCNYAVVEKLRSKDLKGQVAGIMQSTFGTTDKVNAVFIESTDTYTRPAFSLPLTDRTRDGIHYYDYEIRINKNTLPSDASQEFKAAIFIHELLHGYLTFTNSSEANTQMLQHYDIATKYVDGIAQLLTNVFGLDKGKAVSLAIGGVKDLSVSNPVIYNQILNAHHTSQSQINLDYEFQRAGLDGTKCP
ncbi:hypothetical protein KHS38_04225 [Mucilaginibacter sp. Bleaf8]|uniref:hypothetical protein n=1 Tax=Mucilaginibacter sp. Bleaf8 TaxID=2834430 RepID=UPI001BCC149E|nr:hypothetical protein [Mucilaginibacter sp. Bleaf8]MBS7563604.1 hypothetical protein [Mucilaginibacter sp. Bleaf8]